MSYSDDQKDAQKRRADWMKVVNLAARQANADIMGEVMKPDGGIFKGLRDMLPERALVLLAKGWSPFRPVYEQENRIILEVNSRSQAVIDASNPSVQGLVAEAVMKSLAAEPAWLETSIQDLVRPRHS